VFELGEITLFQGKDAFLKIHADGTTEIGYRQLGKNTAVVKPGETGSFDSSDEGPVSWKNGPNVKSDGTLEGEAQESLRLAADGTLVGQKGGKAQTLPLKVSDDRVVLDLGGPPFEISLGADGAVHLPPGAKVAPGHESHVEGADTPGKRRVMLTFMGLMLLSGPGTIDNADARAPTP
jgi:hypothetical protein